MSAGSLQDMEGRPLMSVTIPDYNVAAHLAEAIGYALGENRGNVEVVVVYDDLPDLLELLVAQDPYSGRP